MMDLEYTAQFCILYFLMQHVTRVVLPLYSNDTLVIFERRRGLSEATVAKYFILIVCKRALFSSP